MVKRGGSELNSPLLIKVLLNALEKGHAFGARKQNTGHRQCELICIGLNIPAWRRRRGGGGKGMGSGKGGLAREKQLCIGDRRRNHRRTGDRYLIMHSIETDHHTTESRSWLAVAYGCCARF